MNEWRGKLTCACFLDILPNYKEKWKLNLRTEISATKQFHQHQVGSHVYKDGPKTIINHNG